MVWVQKEDRCAARRVMCASSADAHRDEERASVCLFILEEEIICEGCASRRRDVGPK